MKTQNALWAAVLIVVLAGGYFLFSQPSENENMEAETVVEDASVADKMDGEMESDTIDMAAGLYTSYSPDKLALAEDGDVVLYFSASWCPSCRALDKNIEENLDSIPRDVTILRIDYDTATELKQKYGITAQHTLVQVDADGNEIAQWSGSPTLAALVSKIQ